MTAYQPTTGAPCHCRPGNSRDNCPDCEGTGRRIDFAAIAKKLQPIAAGAVTHNRFMLKAAVDRYELTLFPDGRAIIKGTHDPDKARTLYAKYFGA